MTQDTLPGVRLARDVPEAAAALTLPLAAAGDPAAMSDAAASAAAAGNHKEAATWLESALATRNRGKGGAAGSAPLTKPQPIGPDALLQVPVPAGSVSALRQNGGMGYRYASATSLSSLAATQRRSVASGDGDGDGGEGEGDNEAETGGEEGGAAEEDQASLELVGLATCVLSSRTTRPLFALLLPASVAVFAFALSSARGIIILRSPPL